MIIFDIDGTWSIATTGTLWRGTGPCAAITLASWVPTFAVRTGGFSDTELCGARAIAVYDSLSGLQADLGRIIARN
jgi:hypothetical protein